MKVICIKGNKKLLKGHIYECDFYDTQINQWRTSRPSNTTGKQYYNNRLSIVGFGWYTTSAFTDEHGKSIPSNSIYDVRAKRQPNSEIVLKTGDIIVCHSDRFKNFIKGNKYKISEIQTSKVRSYNRTKIKIEGYNRWITFNSWTFKKLGEQESRDIYLDSLLNNTTINTEIGIKGVENKDKLMLEILSKSILDRNRHELSIVDWAIEKYNRCGLTKDDFKLLLNKKLSKILETI